MRFGWWGKRSGAAAPAGSEDRGVSAVAAVKLGYQTTATAAASTPTLVQFRPAWTDQAYMRFAGIPYRVENSHYHGSAVTGRYPQLQDGHFCLPSAAVLPHLAVYWRNLNHRLSPEERADAAAFSALVLERLQPLLLALRWGVESTVWQSTVRPMRQVLAAPLAHVVPWLVWWQDSTVVKRKCLQDAPVDELVAEASAHYKALDARLGDASPYFFGAAPCTLDAVVFGHVAEAMCDHALVAVLPRYPNLMRWFRLVVDQYFPPVPSTCEAQELNEAESEAFKSAMAGADAVNDANHFNQLRECCAICSQGPPPPVSAHAAPPLRVPGVVEYAPRRQKRDGADAPAEAASGLQSLGMAAGVVGAVVCALCVLLTSIEIVDLDDLEYEGEEGEEGQGEEEEPEN